jgi:plasmid stabilization system protein ParE
VIVLFAEGLAEVFAELPESTKRQAARSIDLLITFPRMYPLRRRGLMRGYRYFLAGRHLFYYSVASTEIRLMAIIPAMMRSA